MLSASDYSAVEALRDLRKIEIRSLKPVDRADYLSAIDRVSASSLYRRFFFVKKGFSEREKEFFLTGC
jgi:hypothetical protein